MRDPRFDVLFESVAVGPKVARNRFFQVPHCNGMGHRHPQALAEMRGVKAEGGWAVVCTECVEIHHTSALDPAVEGRLWSDDDIPAHQAVVEAVHRHGSLAGIELLHSGLNAPNHMTRVASLGPSTRPVTYSGPGQGRAMSQSDIADFRRWHRAAARRSIEAGYDLVYVYAGHSLSLLQQFLSPRYNDRTDCYGGSPENRLRLLREVLEDTLEVCEGTTAVACRLVVDERVPGGLARADIEDLFGTIGELPDLWDLIAGDWDFDSSTSRFAAEGLHEPYVHGFKQLTTKPVVIVGRYTSPDTMVRLVRQGITDFIGAARPSIADPFLPNKIEEGRPDEIRECIGCNVCVAADWVSVPIRCTQNSAMGEEWRRGWHPERIAPRRTEDRVMVVGGGPAGLEAAMWLGRRGHEVVLVEATRELGGRVLRESSLPGLGEWRRVVDHRVAAIEQLDNVLVAYESRMTAAELMGYDFDHVAVATGSRWRRDGLGRSHHRSVFDDAMTPDDILAGRRPAGERVVVYDDENNYIGGSIAELLALDGYDVTLVTSDSKVSAWTVNTMEQAAIHRRLWSLGIRLVTDHVVQSKGADDAVIVNTYTDECSTVRCDSLVSVTYRLPDDSLAADLVAAGHPSVSLIGDAWNPGTIADAVHHGRRFAEELSAAPHHGDDPPFRREIVRVPEEALVRLTGRSS